MKQHEHRRKSIENYLRREFRDKDIEIDHLELIREEWVGTERYDVWDCHVRDEGRWWVLTPMTNLYAQEGDLRSAEFALSFHIGFTTRVRWRGEHPPRIREGFEPLDAVFRELDQAAEIAHQVVEVQNARNAGVALREVLKSFVDAVLALEPEIAKGRDGLKNGDFVGWADAIADNIAAGERVRKLRKYLKSVSRPTWEYVNWLSHDKAGTKLEAVMGLEMVRHLVFVYLEPFFTDSELPDECPSCGSRQLAKDSDYRDDGYEMTRVCETCGWRSEPEWTEYSF